MNGTENKRIYLLPEEGNLYKTNLHSHSTVSDGSFTPEELKKFYTEKGYHAIAYTDHRVCVPHTELTDENFVALTGIERAFSFGTATTVHVCGISRDPAFTWEIPDEKNMDIGVINAAIREMNEKNFITTFNHPRWSALSAELLAAIQGTANMEVVNGYEMKQDGYGDASALYEMELRRGMKYGPLATDDNHRRKADGTPSYEYFCGFTVLKAKELTYDALIESLDTGAYYASTGPMIRNLWLEDKVLHIECSPVCAVYVHGRKFKYRAAAIHEQDDIEVLDINVESLCDHSDYLFINITNTRGEKAWAKPLWFE